MNEGQTPVTRSIIAAFDEKAQQNGSATAKIFGEVGGPISSTSDRDMLVRAVTGKGEFDVHRVSIEGGANFGVNATYG